MTTTSTNGRLHPDQYAAAEFVAARWPKEGSRNEAAGALAGGLLRANCSVEFAECFIEAVASAAHDDEPQKRIERVSATSDRIRRGDKVSGFTKLAQLLGDDGEKVVKHLRVMLGLAIDLAALAAHKALPVEFLEGLGLHDLPHGGVGIPYRDGSGRVVAVKERTALAAKEGSFWPLGKKLMAYGEERLEEGKAAGFRVLVEGESDCWALWYHHFPALGLPGSNTVGKTLALGHVAGVKLLYVVQEPDGGGAQFIEAVAAKLAEPGWDGELRVVRLDGHKDPADLHKADPEQFPERFRQAMDRAQPVAVGPPAADPWPDPMPLGEVPPTPIFPLDVLPEGLRLATREAAAALPCPEDYIAVPLLVMAGGSIGASRALAIKAGHVQRACLYAAVIGPPGSAKTPALDLTVEPAHDVEERLHAAWEEAMRQYEADLEQYEQNLKEHRNKKGDGDAPTKPQRPILPRLTVNDATAEALVPILNENPRGVVLVRDELIGWVQAMNQYREGGKGADQQFWLSAWSGATVSVDRKKTHHLGPLRVRHPFIGVVGGLTPDKLTTLRGDRPRARAEQDGFIDRVLMSYPPEPAVAAENWVEVSDAARERLRSALDRLRSLQMVPVQDGGLVRGWRPFLVRLTADGRRAWQLFTERHAEERNADDFPPHLAGPWSKLRGYAARLALIVHFLRWACGETGCEDVDGESMRRAAKLVGYFKAHARKVYAVMDADPRLALARRLLRHIGKEGLGQFTRRDAYRAMRGPCKAVEDIDPVLTVLETHGYIRPAPPPATTGRPGRKPSLTYEVHPSILGQNGRNGQNAAACQPAGGGPANSVHSVHSVQGPGEENGAGEEGDGSGGQAPESADGEDSGRCVQAREKEEDNRPPSVGGETRSSIFPPDCGQNGHIGQNAEPFEVAGSPALAPYRPDEAHAWGGRLVREPAELAAVAVAIDESVRVGVDTETTGLDPRTDRVRLLSLATDRGTWLIDCFAVDPSRLWDVLAERPVVMHNGLFDLQFLRRLGFEPGAAHDTMILSRLLHGTRRPRGFHGLGACAARELGQSLDKAEQKSDWSAALTSQQLAYAALDAAVLLALYESLDARVREAGMARVAEIERRCLPAVAWLCESGVGFDPAAWADLAAGAQAKAGRLSQELDAAAPYRPGCLTPMSAWAWDSPAQVREAFALLGHDLETTDDDALAGVDHPLAGLVREYRSAQKLAATYGPGWAGDAIREGRIHAAWQQIGADSGRMACKEPNLQNLPRDRRYRGCFVAPPGRVLVKADYSQIELRIAAKVSGDRAMLDAYLAGQDLHALTCQRVLGVSEVTKGQRQLAKAINFGLLYGMGARGFRAYALAQYGLRLTEAEAGRYRDAFFGAYPGLRRWHRSIANPPIDTRTLAGRRRQGVKRYTEKLNTPVQGSGADGLKLALALLWERRAECPGAFPVLVVHDEIVVECDAGQADAAEAWLRQAMLDGMAPLIDPVPVEVEVTAGQTWGGD
jgi:DNA polymerase-1